MARLGFIGLGVMGGRVAKRLMDAGHSVVGYNRTRSKAEWLIERGMVWGDSPREVAEAVDISFSMVTNTAALQGVAEGLDGFLAGLGRGKVHIDMSTVSPAYSRELAEQVAACGAALLDAPVSGSVSTLEEGKLSIMVGGDPSVFEKVKPVLLDIGPKVTYVGANGLAVSMKIATNLSLAVQMLAFSEGVLIAEKSGIRREAAVEVLTNSVIGVAHGEVPGALRAANAGRSLVQREHDAEGYEPGARIGPPVGRAAAHHGGDERIPHGGARDGIGRAGFCDPVQCAGENGRSPGMNTNTKKTAGSHLEAPDVEHWLHVYEQMAKIREFEEKVNELYMKALMPGLAHLYSGQEAVAVGVCESLRRDDYITSTHRGHGHCLAKGAELHRMFAELLGKEAGYCRGKGGSMHIADPELGNLGANAIVGGSAGIATGAAFSAKMRGTDQVAVCFFGEGALGQGLVYEVMNMASLWKLPVIYVCENNTYNEYTHFSETLAGEISTRAKAFGIHYEVVDGQDVQLVYETTQKLVERARRGEGPAFLECQTYRYYGHHVGDINRAYYRSKEEEQEWRTDRDPLKILAERLIGQKLTEQSVLDSILNDIQTEVESAVQFALEAPYPDKDEVDQDVYA